MPPRHQPLPLTVSVIIRAKNEARTIGAVLDAIWDQVGGPHDGGQVEVILVDSGSTDGTVEIAQRKGARVLHIAPADFTYGRALNLGVQQAAGQVTVQLSAHCLPVDAFWLRSLVLPFEADPQIAGVFGRDLLWPDATMPDNARELFQNWRWNPTVSRYAPPQQPAFSNSNSAGRRDVVLGLPYHDTLAAGEDEYWARTVMARGWRIYYSAEARVWHGHYQTWGALVHLGWRAAGSRLGVPDPLADGPANPTNPGSFGAR